MATQLRAADDPWASTQSEDEQQSASAIEAAQVAAKSIFSFLTTPIGAAKTAGEGDTITTQQQAQPGQQTKVLTPSKPTSLGTSWFKTPLGIASIIAGAFVGWRYYKRRKAKAA